uniref:Bm13566 n=1 Tax=Brugia malayi TaxID=6279 RepID=A0A1I9G595_BRUMA|nr:Bm13566 [Brugia malayi]
MCNQPALNYLEGKKGHPPTLASKFSPLPSPFINVVGLQRWSKEVRQSKSHNFTPKRFFCH